MGSIKLALIIIIVEIVKPEETADEFYIKTLIIKTHFCVSAKLPSSLKTLTLIFPQLFIEIVVLTLTWHLQYRIFFILVFFSIHKKECQLLLVLHRNMSRIQMEKLTDSFILDNYLFIFLARVFPPCKLN
jgi:hypothetical protein